MRYLAIFALVATLSYAAGESSDGDVVVITAKNVDEVLKKKDSLVFVKFFAPWCGHCQAMAEDFKSAATVLRGKAVLAEVDATKEEKLAQSYNVEGFPTLKLFSGGEEVADYQGNRDKDSMVKFVERALLPAYETMADTAAYDKFVAANKDNRLVVAVKPEGESAAMFKKAAYGIRDVMTDIAFVAVNDPASLKGVSAKAGDVYYADVGEKREYIKWDSEKYPTVDKFVKTVGLPVFQEFTQENADIYVELGIPVVVGFYKDASEPGVDIMSKVAHKKAGNGKVAFAWVDNVKLASFVEYVGLKGKDPAICAYSFETDQRYLLPEGFKLSEASLEEWVDKLIAGTVEPTRKSEPIPEVNEGPVYTVVGDSWEDIVEDKNTDVMIAQVASWCGHCKALKPIYKKVAEELKKAGVKGVKLAIMDATENDAPGDYKAKGFPTIHFFPAGKEGIEFDGDRSSKAIIEWIQKHAVNKFEFDTSKLGEDPEPEKDDDEEPEGEEEGMEGEGEEGFEDAEDEAIPEDGEDVPPMDEDEHEEPAAEGEEKEEL